MRDRAGTLFRRRRVQPLPALSRPDWSRLFRAGQPVDRFLAAHPELEDIARQPQFTWIGEQADAGDVAHLVHAANGYLLPLVLYAIPDRDAGQHSAGGFRTAGAYLSWVQAVVEAIGRAPAVLVLEPDALGHGLSLPQRQRRQREATIRTAIGIIAAAPLVHLYVDASMWVPASSMRDTLDEVGVGGRVGVSVNVANYQWTDAAIDYGEAVATPLGCRYIVDTSRNGKGPLGNEWCNPPGRALGACPGTIPERGSRCDGLLWIKRPGMSDGPCNGGPRAGEFSVDLAASLIHEMCRAH